MSSSQFIGIDLGTTYSAIAKFENSRTAMLLNEEGELLTPSVVYFQEGEVLVGREAKQAALQHAESVAVCAKRDMGKKLCSDPINGRYIPPTVVQAFILRKLQQIAHSHDPDKEVQAVVTVPAYFNETRRQATIDAADIAGVDVLDIINEPTAAALAFGEYLGYLTSSGTLKEETRVLVYDLGGGTFDVTLIELSPASFRTIATDGDAHLGGYDWDMRLASHLEGLFQEQYGVTLREDRDAWQRVLQTVEATKQTLSVRKLAKVDFEYGGNRLECEVTRDLFEELTEDLLERTAMTTEMVMREAGWSVADLSQVLLVGGSTRMPMISRMLDDMIGITPSQAINPDEAVARGAAIYAGYLAQTRDQVAPDDFNISNVNSHSLGIVGTSKTYGDKQNVILIPRNTPLPAEVHRVFSTCEENQSRAVVQVLEGETQQPEYCSVVGTAIIDLPPNLATGWPIRVSYRFENNGRLSVSALVKDVAEAVSVDFKRARQADDGENTEWKQLYNLNDLRFSDLSEYESGSDLGLLRGDTPNPVDESVPRNTSSKVSFNGEEEEEDNGDEEELASSSGILTAAPVKAEPDSAEKEAIAAAETTPIVSEEVEPASDAMEASEAAIEETEPSVPVSDQGLDSVSSNDEEPVEQQSAAASVESQQASAPAMFSELAGSSKARSVGRPANGKKKRTVSTARRKSGPSIGAIVMTLLLLPTVIFGGYEFWKRANQPDARSTESTDRMTSLSLLPIRDKTTAELETVEIQCAVRNPLSWRGKLKYSLDPKVRALGAAIDPETGRLTWTPGEEMGGETYTLRVVASAGNVNDLQEIRIHVREANQAPVLHKVSPIVVGPGDPVQVQLRGEDADLPAQELEYELKTELPDAKLDPASGLFVWQSSTGDAGRELTVNVSVRDAQGETAVQTFVISVSDPNGRQARSWLPLDVASGTENAATPSAKRYHSRPSDEARRAAQRKIQEDYSAQLKSATTADAKRTLGLDLMDQLESAEDDPAMTFALIEKSHKLLIDADALEPALQNAAILAEQFGFKPYRTVAAVLSKIQGKTKQTREKIPAVAIANSRLALEDDDFVMANQLVGRAASSARRISNRQLTIESHNLKKQIVRTEMLYKEMKQAEATIEVKSQDAASSRIIGAWHWFVKGNPSLGMKHLGLGGDDPLCEMARQDIRMQSQPKKPPALEILKLADAWWLLASSAQDEHPERLRHRASYWYQIALPDLDGTLADKASSRMAEVGIALRPQPAAEPPAAKFENRRPDVDVSPKPVQPLEQPGMGFGIPQFPVITNSDGSQEIPSFGPRPPKPTARTAPEGDPLKGFLRPK